RQASGSVSAVAAAPGTLAEGAGPPAPRPGTDKVAPRPPLWEEFYRSVSPAQQVELLSLAERQGLLYAHQLPAAGNGNRGPTPDLPAGPLNLLAQLLGPQPPGLEPVRPAPVAVLDTALDAGQREAVARALGTPDLCLIQGLPGTGKSRVAAE